MLPSTRGVVIFDPCEFKAFEIIEKFGARLDRRWMKSHLVEKSGEKEVCECVSIYAYLCVYVRVSVCSVYVDVCVCVCVSSARERNESFSENRYFTLRRVS